MAEPGLHALLHELTNQFFEALPERLPHIRNVGWIIPPKPGDHKPPFKHACRLSPSVLRLKVRLLTLLHMLILSVALCPGVFPFCSCRERMAHYACVWTVMASRKLLSRTPLPRTDDLLDQLQRSTMFCSLDPTSGYHQIALEDVSKTA